MKILVTGGAGFIASHIVDAYVSAGHRVVVVDNVSTGKKENLNPKAIFYHADINDMRAVEKICAAERPEIINHHAAFTEVIRSMREPEATFQTNVVGEVNLLIAGQRHGLKKIIFSSTCAAYGGPKKIPAPETTPLLPLSPYGFSKILGEECITFYSRVGKLAYTIFRYPNVYGPRQNPFGEAGVVAIFSNILKEGKQPTIFGNGKKGRDYVFVSDIVRANTLALKKGDDQTINLGSGNIVTDDEVFKAIATSLQIKIKPRYAPVRAGEVHRISITNQRAKKYLGWQPKVSFEEGVRLYHKNLPSS